MNRSGPSLFDPRVAAWLEDDPHRAPDRALEVQLALRLQRLRGTPI